jgi:hypothetical protein
MVFIVKVFGSDGFQRDSKQKENRVQQSEQLNILYCILNPLVIYLNELNTKVHVSIDL